MSKISTRLMQAHVEDLCDEYGIGWCVVTSPRNFGSRAYRELWEIETVPIKGRLSYATALHEIGHLVGPYQHPRWRTMMREIGAWKWARRNALIWSPGMEKHAQECLAYYTTVNSYGITNAEQEDRIREAHDRMWEVVDAIDAINSEAA